MARPGGTTRMLLAVGLAWTTSCAPGDRVRDLPAKIAVDDPLLEVGTAVGRVAKSSAGAPPRIAGVQPAHARGRRLALVAPAPALVHYDVHVPPRAVLLVGAAVAIEGDRADDPGDGHGSPEVRFRVHVDGDVVWELEWDGEASHWVDAEIDLGAYGNRSVTLGLETAGAGSDAGEPAWSRLQVVQRTRIPRVEASPGSPNVLLLVVDTLRADRIGACGATTTRTPNLDRLAAGGTVFRNAWAQAPWTLPSVTTIMTGRYPRGHGLVGRSARFGRPGGFTSDDENWAYLGDDIPTIASSAQRAGVTTFGVTSNLLISKENNVARGFETFVELPVSPMPIQWARAADVHRAFDRWLDVGGRHRFLAYLHYMEPHEPYVPATPELRAGCPEDVAERVCDGVFRELARASEKGGAPIAPAVARYLEALYDGEVEAWDAALPGLLAILDRRGLLDRTVIVLTSDHGEEFAEHGHLGHRKQLFAESLAVPLIIVGPGVPSVVRDDLVEHVDVLPTVAALLGVRRETLNEASTITGQNLLGPETGRAWTFAETRYGVVEGQERTELQAVRNTAWSYHRAPARGYGRLFDLGADPGETEDRSAAAPAMEKDLAARLDGWNAAVTPPPAPPSSMDQLDDKLRALGYLE